ncbi:MAG: MarR family transcriptional regulator [Alphaproteobacteria bacterium]|nr:MarR family transcriptional regulator [Alphaproteobacteria bacterium]
MTDSKADAETARQLAMAGELRVLVGRLKRRLQEEASVGDLTPSQVSALRQLWESGPATVTTLARAEGVRPQSMGATIAALDVLGLVSGSPDPDDGRQTILSLTPACRKLIKDGRAAREDWLFRTIRKKLSPREQETLAGGIRLLERLLET